MTTHAMSEIFLEGYLTRCGKYTEQARLLSDEPTCPECRCWMGLCRCVEYHDWSTHIDGCEGG